MKKHILSVILVIAMLSSFITLHGFAASSSAQSEAQKILSDLGIVSSSENAKDFMTRGEYANEISKVMNVESLPAGYVLPFEDVSASSSCYNGVYNLYAWRAISEATLFRPDDVITSNEALKIAVSLLGYDFLALANGGYPAGYAATASSLGIAPRAMGEQITKAQAFEIMFNMLHTKMPTVTITGDGQYNYSPKAGDTLLSERWKLDVVNGIVTDCEKFGINNAYGVGEGYVGIEGTILRNDIFDTDACFGEEVDVYYETDSKKIRADSFRNWFPVAVDKNILLLLIRYLSHGKYALSIPIVS